MRPSLTLALLLACSTAGSDSLRLAREAVPDATVTATDVRWPGQTLYLASAGDSRVGLAVSDAGEVLGGRAAALRIAPSPDDDPAAVAALINLLTDPDPAARGTGVHLAGGAPDARVTPPIIDEGLLTYWRRTPGSDGWTQCRVALEPLGQVACRPAEVVQDGEPPPIAPIDRARTLLASSEERDRARGYELGATLRTGPAERTRPDDASALLLQGALTDPAATNRVKAIRLLGAQRTPSAIPDLRGILRADAHPEVRLEATRVLGRWKATEALSDIARAAEADPSERVRNTAAQVRRGLEGR